MGASLINKCTKRVRLQGKLAFWKSNNSINPTPAVLFASRDLHALRVSMSLAVAFPFAAIGDGDGRVVKVNFL
jgi:hypothetical protein